MGGRGGQWGERLDKSGPLTHGGIRGHLNKGHDLPASPATAANHKRRESVHEILRHLARASATRVIAAKEGKANKKLCSVGAKVDSARRTFLKWRKAGWKGPSYGMQEEEISAERSTKWFKCHLSCISSTVMTMGSRPMGSIWDGHRANE